MSFFYDLNKKLDAIRQTPSKTHGQLNERDMGKHNNATTGFKAVADKAAKEYGSKAAGERVAGAVKAKMAKAGKLEEEEGMSRAAKGYEKYGKQGMEALAKAGREGKALDPIRKKYDKYDNKEVSEDFGPGREGPNRNQAGPGAISPDFTNYKTPNLDQHHDAKQTWDDMRGPGAYAKWDPEGRAHRGAWASDARGQEKYVDRTAPGIVNKIKDKMGWDKPDSAYGPRPDERERLEKRYPKPTQESGAPVVQAKPSKPAPAKPSKPAPKGNMGTIKGGVWTADPPKPGERGVPAPSGDPEGVQETGMTPKQKSFAKLAPPADKITFADKIAGAKKEVDEMLGDVAAEAMRSALGGGKGRNAEMDEANAFDYKSPRDAAPKVGSVERGAKHDIKHTATGRMVTRRTDDQGHSVGADDDSDTQAGPRGRGRPKGTKNVSSKAKVFQRKSKLMTKEGDQDITDQGEYDQEGDMAKDDIKTIVRHAQALSKVLGDNDNLPEWVQSKLAKIEGMMISIDEYMQNQASDDGEEEPIAEKAVSKKQQRFMGMVHAAQKGEKPASKEVGKVAKTMKKKDAEDFASTKHKGLPEKKKKEVDENSEEGKLSTTVSSDGSFVTSSSTGRVSATLDKGKWDVKPGAPLTASNDTKQSGSGKGAKTGGMSFGKGIYDSMNFELEQMIAESMSVNMSDSTEGNRSLTVTATDEDAMKLAMILKSAGLGGDAHSHEESCPTCGMEDCGCGDIHQEVDENAPDWPTNTEKADNNFGYSGGVNKPKSSGMATIPVTDVSLDGEDMFSKQVREDDLRRMQEMAGIKNEEHIDLGPRSPEIAAMSNDEVNAAIKASISPEIAAMDPDEVNAALGLDQDEQYEDSIQRMREMAGIKEAKKDVEEEKTEEGNLFTGNLAKARADGKKQADLDGDGDLEKVRESIFSLTNQWRTYKG